MQGGHYWKALAAPGLFRRLFLSRKLFLSSENEDRSVRMGGGEPETLHEPQMATWEALWGPRCPSPPALPSATDLASP